MEEKNKSGGSAVLARSYGMLPGPDEALEQLRQAEERRSAGNPGIPAMEMPNCYFNRGVEIPVEGQRTMVYY